MRLYVFPDIARSSTLNGSFPNQLIASLPNPYPVPNTRISLAFDAGGSFLSQRDIYAALNQLRGNVERDLKDGAHDYDAIPYGYIASAYQGAEVGVWSAEHQPIQMTYIYAMQVLEGLVTKLSSDGYREWSAKVLLEGQLDIGDLLLDARPLSLLD